jgi:hypothetical protein
LTIATGIESFYLGTVGVIPLLFIAFSTGQLLWKDVNFSGGINRWKLVIGAVLLGLLPISEIIAIGSLVRNRYAHWWTVFILVSLALVLTDVAWRLGWSIWNSLGPQVQESMANTWPKRAFYLVGLVTVAACVAGTVWAASY